MDALSEALSAVRMTAAIFVDALFTAPWGFASPPAQRLAPVLAPGTERLVVYHLVSEGEALVRMPGGQEMPLAAGDIVIVPHGDAHVVSHGVPPTLLDTAVGIDRYLSDGLRPTRYGGGGEVTRFVCGYFGCERHAGRLFLAGLPPLIRINIRGDASGAWLENSILHLVRETGSGRPGRTVLLSKMAEALFIETLRRYMEEMPAEQRGWLAGARDPVVGGALALLHQEPCHPWNLAELAVRVGASRSVLAERFTHYLDESPMSYLSRWRLQLAARLLQTSRKTMLQVASDVGYESEAAFNRAFKREFGLPPAQYRRSLAVDATDAAAVRLPGRTRLQRLEAGSSRR